MSLPPLSESPTVELFGVAVDALTMAQSVERVRHLVEYGTPVQHVVINASKVVAMNDDPELRNVIQSCPMINADGSSVVWASRLLGRPLPERVAGIDLFEQLLAMAESDGLGVFLLGARQHVVDRLVDVLGVRYPRLRICGARDGYWDDDDEIVDQVRESGANLLFLAIPSPRKEFWLADHLPDLGVSFAMGVGGSFDVMAGFVHRAPMPMQRLGLEWVYRLVQEPRRMWKRYLVGNTKFIGLVLRGYLSAR